MAEYRVLTFAEEHMLPQEVVEEHGTIIEADTLQEARERFAEKMWDEGIFREEYEDFLDFFREPKGFNNMRTIRSILDNQVLEALS